MKYHKRLEEIQTAFECVAELIEKGENNLKTADTDDDFFGRKHIPLFGDLLQFPPIKIISVC